MRQRQAEIDADALDDLVEALDALGAVAGVVVAEPHVERGQRRLVDQLDLAIDELQHRIEIVFQPMVVLDRGLAEAALEAGVVGIGRVGRDLRAEQVERQRVVQVELLLDGRQIDHAERPHLVDGVRVVDTGRLHRLAGALHDAADAGLADEHVMRLFGQHEAAGARQRIEARLRQQLELHLAVAVGEEGEHEQRQPVRRRLVEGAEHARRVLAAGAAAQHVVGLVAAVAAEILVQQIDHRPEMAALLDVDLEQVAHVVERRRGLAEMALLLDRRGLGVALDHDEAAQHGAIFARHVLPHRLADDARRTESCDPPRRRQQDAPAVFRHLDVVELGPALGIDRHRGAQIDEQFLEALRPHVLPPVEIAGMPAFERLQHAAVLGEVDVVRNFLAVVDVDDVHHRTLL